MMPKIHPRILNPRCRSRSMATDTKAVLGINSLPVPRPQLVVLEPGEVSGPAATGLAETGHDEPAEGWGGGEVSEKILPVRRGESSSRPSWDILASMASSDRESDAGAGAATRDGISAFIARVLDQLMLSAWLPAALLTASLAVLLQFRSAKSVNLLDAVRSLTSNPVRVLVLVVPALIIATVVTQAFSFEAIKTLEGYWHRPGPSSWTRNLMIRRQVRKREAIGRRKQKAYEQAFFAVRGRMIDAGISFNVLNAIEAGMHNRAIPPLKKAELTQLANMDWRSQCDAWRLAKIDSLIDTELTYPIPSRILPTRLGNLIRATEDQLHTTDGDVEGFALQRYDKMPPGIQAEHDQFRNRLDMYCTMVFVSASIAVLTPALLVGRSITVTSIAIICAGFAALSFASYRAALASARGYCDALRQMDRIYPTGEEIVEVA